MDSYIMYADVYVRLLFFMYQTINLNIKILNQLGMPKMINEG